MFSPEMMKMAQEQMSKMTPEQMAAMQSQMGNMSPDMMRQAMGQMKNMSPDQMKTAQERMNNMSAEEMMQASSQAGSMNTQMKAQQDYVYNASMKLKTDGNYLVGTTQYSEAVEKYTRAINNLKEITTSEASTLSQSCQLNLALCYVKLGRNRECVEVCSEVLKKDPNNLKAAFRRGQAHQSMGSLETALVDLRRAHQLAPQDETVKEVYEELRQKMEGDNLDEAKLKEAEEKVRVELEEAEAAKAKAEAEAKEIDAMLAKAEMHNTASKKMQENPEMMARAVEEMKKNPESMKGMAKMLKEMPPEQLSAMAKNQPGMEGMPELTPEMAKMMADQFENMTPEQLDQMSEMAASMRGGAGASPSSSGGGGMPNMANMDQDEMMKTMNEQMKNPEMRSMMNNMMKNITPEQMKSMAGATGMKMSDAQAEAMAAQMKGMKDEDLERMMKMAQTFQTLKLWVLKNKLIVIGIFILIIGMFLRWMGWA